MKELQLVMSVDALLTWQRKHHGYVAPSRHHLAHPTLWHNATEIEVYCHFCERGLLTLDYFSEGAGGRTGMLLPRGSLFTDFALARSRTLL